MAQAISCYHGRNPPRFTKLIRPAATGVQLLLVALILLSAASAFRPPPSQNPSQCPSQARPASRVNAGASEDGNLDEDGRLRSSGRVNHTSSLLFPVSQDGNLGEEGRLRSRSRGDKPEGLHPLPPQLLSRRTILENARAAAVAAAGGGLMRPARAYRGAPNSGAIGAGVSTAVGGWGAGLGHGGVRSAEAFGGPTRPLNRCLVNAVNAREFCRRLEADLAAGRNEQECRGMVKGVLRGLSLQESIKDAVLYLPGGKRQAAGDAGQSAVEYLASVVEFDAWDKLDKDWTSNVALRNMTPENVMFVRMALDASGSAFDTFLQQFDKADVDSARELYRMYFLPAE